MSLDNVFNGKDYTILNGNSLETLKQLPENSVNMCVTSPPYWGIRFYGTPAQIWGGDKDCVHDWVLQLSRRPRSEDDVKDPESIQNKHSNCNLQETHICKKCDAYKGELGQESSPERFIENLLTVFDEVYRVLHPTGVCFVNIGYTWNNNSNVDHPFLKEKDIVPIPEMFAIGMQKRGWYWRVTNIWDKPNCAPYSGKDRTTVNYEYIYMFTKNSRYFYDQDAIREPHKEVSLNRIKYAFGKNGNKSEGQAIDFTDRKPEDFLHPAGANKRAVWRMSTSNDRTGHAAPFCEELPKTCIMCGTSAYGRCKKCGTQYERNVERTSLKRHELNPADERYRPKRYETKHEQLNGSAQAYIAIKDKGWVKACKCETNEIEKTVVLDPFNGSGSTGLIALQMGRKYIGSELLEEYVALTKTRFDGGENSLFTLID